jgi:transcriptional regulator with XRE-family HTH domain
MPRKPNEDTPTLQAIGRNIAKLRERKGWTQEDLAMEIGAGSITISQYERGIRGPSYGRLKKIAEALDCSARELVSNLDG